MTLTPAQMNTVGERAKYLAPLFPVFSCCLSIRGTDCSSLRLQPLSSPMARVQG